MSAFLRNIVHDVHRAAELVRKAFQPLDQEPRARPEHIGGTSAAGPDTGPVAEHREEPAEAWVVPDAETYAPPPAPPEERPAPLEVPVEVPRTQPIEVAPPSPLPEFGPLQTLYQEGLGGGRYGSVDQRLLRSLCEAVVEGNWPAYRYESPRAADQLRSLNEAQRAQWTAQARSTLRQFPPESEALLSARVRQAALTALEVLEALPGRLGSREQLQAKHTEVVEALRAHGKSVPEGASQEERAAHNCRRNELARTAGELSKKLGAYDLCTSVSLLDPNIRDTAAVAALAKSIRGALGLLDEERQVLLEALTVEDLRVSQLSYEEDPPFLKTHGLFTSMCIPWPDPSALAMYTDANKKLVCLTTDDHRTVWGVLRLVEGATGKLKGQPMLLLERVYPDPRENDPPEVREALLRYKEVVVRQCAQRAKDMGLRLLVASEYYWDCTALAAEVTKELSKGYYPRKGRELPDMNEHLRRVAADLDLDITTTSKNDGPPTAGMKRTLVVPPSNSDAEYIESAPRGGLDRRGHVQHRHYSSVRKAMSDARSAKDVPILRLPKPDQEPEDIVFENLFIIFTPRTPTAE